MEKKTNISMSETEIASAPDPSWKGLYRAGGVSAFLYVILALVVPTLQVFIIDYDFSMNGAAVIQYIASNRFSWLMLQTLVLGTSILAIITFMAIFVSLRHLNKSYAAISASIAIVLQVLFIAYYPILLGLVYLSDQYTEVSEAQKIVLETAAEALMAQNNAFNPLYESVFAVSILIISLVMLQGVYPKYVAWLGIITFASAIIALALWPVLGIAYFWWWLFFTIWFIMVGFKLYRLGE